MFIPLGVLMHGGRSINGTIDWEEVVVVAWVLFCLAIPGHQPDRMRGGDLIAGTMVIALPKVALLSDLVERTLQFTFTPAQLQAYGAFELQVLEELLRRPRSRETVQVLDDVCDKICRKIGWTAPVPRKRRGRLPARLLHRRARLPRARAALRQGAGGQIRAPAASG